MNDNDSILVLGGSGFLGRAFLAEWIEVCGGAGGRLVVPTRRLAHGRAVQSLPGVELVEADVHDEAQLLELMRGRGAVLNLVAILHGSEADFRHVHVELPHKLARTCRSAGVPKLIHVSALGAASNAPSRYLRSKAEGEGVLRKSGLEPTVLRPSVMFGAEDRFLNVFAKLQRAFPVIPLAGAFARFQPVWVEDVAAALARCLQRPDTAGRIFECTGPRVYTLADLVRLAGRWSGHPRPIVPLPDMLGRMQAAAMELLPGEPLMSRDNLDSMRVPNIASGSFPGLSALGIEPTALDAVAPQYLGAATSGRGRLNALRQVSRRR